jgi:hypothetical protein
MPTADIYVQITASSDSPAKSRAVLVLVPGANIENFRRKEKNSTSDDYAVAQLLAEPLAGYAFTHRAIFSTFKISHSFPAAPPPEIQGRSPNLSQSGIKAWIIS